MVSPLVSPLASLLGVSFSKSIISLRTSLLPLVLTMEDERRPHKKRKHHDDDSLLTRKNLLELPSEILRTIGDFVVEWSPALKQGDRVSHLRMSLSCTLLRDALPKLPGITCVHHEWLEERCLICMVRASGSFKYLMANDAWICVDCVLKRSKLRSSLVCHRDNPRGKHLTEFTCGCPPSCELCPHLGSRCTFHSSSSQ